MSEDKDERRRAIVYDSRCLRAAEQRKVVFEVRRAMAAFAACQIVFQVAVIRGDRAD
jgi:hypothetical protein